MLRDFFLCHNNEHDLVLDVKHLARRVYVAHAGHFMRHTKCF